MGFGEEREVALAEKIFVIEQEFFKARAGDADEFEFGLFRGAAGLACFGDVLASAASGLDLWSVVRDRGSMKRAQNLMVAS